MRNAPGKGKINISKHSSLRKLMRASRRGKIPDERMVIIEVAERKAASRAKLYMHATLRNATP